ncbi:MAG: metallophosphoesterase [Leptospiraceae bacterium]|nr:metallophosphoesterase [Leptospiraceae bacterium]
MLKNLSNLKLYLKFNSEAISYFLYLLLLLSISCISSPASKSFKDLKVDTTKFQAEFKDPKQIKILIFGDSGTGNENQYRVAKAMKEVCDKEGCDFGILLGDNFYETGISSADDAQFDEKFEKPYSPLGIKIYAVLGNHDYGLAGMIGGNTKYQVEYTSRSKYWVMPHSYYNIAGTEVELIGLDTNPFKKDKLQQEWLYETLEQSKARWVLVFAHHPFFSGGRHGDDKGLEELLFPKLCQYADIYLAGHEHDLQLLQEKCDTEYFPHLISGAAGKKRATGKSERSLFAREGFGFTRLVLAGETMKIYYYDDYGKEVFHKDFPKRQIRKK